MSPVAPLYGSMFSDHRLSLAVALLIGIAFGWFLERGGLGSAPKLASQFYLTDLTVFKVLFTAIVTAMVGLFVLSWTGGVDLARLYVPETYLVPQIAGGALFGVGFLLAGLCPGTSCVAAAAGRLDGLAVLFGLLAGIFLLGELPAVHAVADRTALGTLTLDAVLDAPRGFVIAAVTLVALGAFAGAEWLERRRGGIRSSARQPATRRVLGVAAVAVALVALGSGLRPPTSASDGIDELAGIVEREEDHVTALELARWIRDGTRGLRVVDVRDARAYAAYHIPGAERLSVDSLARTRFSPEETIVLYSEGGAHAAQGWFFVRARGHERVYFLRGGVYEWLEQVMEPTLPANASAAQRASYDEARALSRWFGGMPTSIALEPDRAGSAVPALPRAGTDSAVHRIRRRGC